MDNNSIKTMDVNILLSLINTKLRDDYSSLDRLCEDMDVDKELIIERLEKIDYHYDNDQNSFK